MNYKEREFHAWGLYHSQYTSRMWAVMVKQEKEAEKNNSKRVEINLEERDVGTKVKGPKQGVTRAKDLTSDQRERFMMLLPWRRFL